MKPWCFQRSGHHPVGIVVQFELSAVQVPEFPALFNLADRVRFGIVRRLYYAAGGPPPLIIVIHALP